MFSDHHSDRRIHEGLGEPQVCVLRLAALPNRMVLEPNSDAATKVVAA